MVLCALRDVWGDKQGDSVTTDTWICYSLIKRCSPHAGSFSLFGSYQRPWLAPSPNSQIKPLEKKKLLKKKDVIHYFISSVYLFLLLSLHFLPPWERDDQVASPQTYLQGKCWNLLFGGKGGTWHFRYRWVLSALFFRTQSEMNSLNSDHPAIGEQWQKIKFILCPRKTKYEKMEEHRLIILSSRKLD